MRSSAEQGGHPINPVSRLEAGEQRATEGGPGAGGGVGEAADPAADSAADSGDGVDEATAAATADARHELAGDGVDPSDCGFEMERFPRVSRVRRPGGVRARRPTVREDLLAVHNGDASPHGSPVMSLKP